MSKANVLLCVCSSPKPWNVWTLGAAVRAVHPGDRRAPLELGDLRRVGEGIARAEQGLDVDAVVDDGRGHEDTPLSDSFGRSTEVVSILGPRDTVKVGRPTETLILGRTPWYRPVSTPAPPS
jgi:hypothetical protein